MTNPSDRKLAFRTGRNTIIVNVLLSAFKLFAGIFANSAAMIADAMHSITDLISTLVVMVGIKAASKAPDKGHPYGHERFESVATLILAALITSVGVLIGWSGIDSIISGDFRYLEIPGMLALIAAVVSLVVKEGMFWYVRAAAKKTNSDALMADAWHSRADGLSSIGSFIGIGGAMLGFPIFDSLAAIVISLFILKTAFSIARDALGRMTDSSCDDETVEKIRQTVLSHDQVKKIDLLRTRKFGSRVYVDLEISVDAEMSLRAAHDVAENVHSAIEERHAQVKHCMVHVNPCQCVLDASE